MQGDKAPQNGKDTRSESERGRGGVRQQLVEEIDGLAADTLRQPMLEVVVRLERDAHVLRTRQRRVRRPDLLLSTV